MMDRRELRLSELTGLRGLVPPTLAKGHWSELRRCPTRPDRRQFGYIPLSASSQAELLVGNFWFFGSTG